MRLSFDQILADRARMERFICERISGGVTRIDLGGGAWAELMAFWDDEFGWTLLLESDEPDRVDLWEVYDHFRRKEMTAREWWQEFEGDMNRWKVHDLEKENFAMGYELNHLRQAILDPQARTEASIPLISALPELASIANSLARIADAVDPPPLDKVGSDYIAKRLGIGLARVSQMATGGEIPPSCIVAGTGHGKIWKFHRVRIDEWINNGRT